MKKKIITITASLAAINAIGFIFIPGSTQKILSESIYLKTLKEKISICLT